MLRGFVKCPQCGAAVSADANFCEECGAQMPPKAAPQPAGELRCEGCGKMIPSDSKFCGGCGRPVAPPAPPAPAVRICPQCGAACDEGSVFCTKCGTRLDGVTEEEGAQV